MAKIDDESGVTVVKGSGKPPKAPLEPTGKPPRRFPLRLWLYAILMTGAAGAAGYFAYQFYDGREDARKNLAACTARQSLADADATARATCEDERDRLRTERLQIETQLDSLSKNLDASKDELAALRVQRAETEKRLAAIEEIQKKFAEMISAGNLQVKSRRGNLVVVLPSEVLFETGSADLKRDGFVKVVQVAAILSQMADRRFMVVGHTDNTPVKGGAFKDNWELSTKRAVTVTKYLIEGGMKPEQLLASGAGEFDPVSDNNDAEQRGKNRRIEIVLLPQLSELPPLPASLEEKVEKAGVAPDKPTEAKPADAKPADAKPAP